MKFNLLKKLELTGKHLLNKIFRLIFYRTKRKIPALTHIRKILIFRLDQRIGNGILLLPLLKVIKASQPDIQLHLLIHYPVAGIIQKYSSGLVDVFWPYHQKKILFNPLYLLKWLINLRREKYDLIISSHNPDNFSFSQALLGRWCKPGVLMGFRWKDSPFYYDIAIDSSNEKHYSDSHLDIWRYFDNNIKINFNNLHVPKEIVEMSFKKWRIAFENLQALFWLGATGDKVLPVNLVSLLYEKISEQTGLKIQVAIGPSDLHYLEKLPKPIRKAVIVWDRSIEETAVFFAGFQLFVSGDTGPMHLAVALGVPTLTLFTNSKISQYGYNDGHSHFSLRYSEDLSLSDTIIRYLRLIAERVKKR